MVDNDSRHGTSELQKSETRQRSEEVDINSKDEHQSDETKQQDGSPSEKTPHGKNGVKDDNDDKNSEKPKPPPRTRTEKLKAKIEKQKQKAFGKANPPGGFDDTPIPSADDGYTVKFTFHRAENLPIADLGSGASDPFLLATLTSQGIQQRHKQDPDMRLRTKTIHRDTNPKWEQEWVVAGIPSAGFKLKCRIYDEDSTDSDDRLGNVTVIIPSIGEHWSGMKELSHPVKKRMGSWRAYLLKGITQLCSSGAGFTARLVLSIEVLGRSDPPYGRMYTLGPAIWTKHYSPMIGRLAGTKAPERDDGGGNDDEKPKVEKYDFQANQLQLRGPVPAKLYHRFVEFKPFVKGMFDATGLRGRILNAALHHQHARVYNYSSSTKYGVVEPCTTEASRQFLKMAHFVEGSRLFTYVLTLDGLLRFTETGKEFGIDLLSKHTMHSDVNIYIACSGEFFIRRTKGHRRETQRTESHRSDGALLSPSSSHASNHNNTHNSDGNSQKTHPSEQDPSTYELIIDNDSGTYRPEASLLPKLKDFLETNFPGIKITTYPCDSDKLQDMKKKQRERKKKDSGNMLVMQQSRKSDGGWSSSDEEDLEARAGNGGGGPSKKERMLRAVEDPNAAYKEEKMKLRHRKSGEGQKGKEENGKSGQNANGEGEKQKRGDEGKEASSKEK